MAQLKKRLFLPLLAALLPLLLGGCMMSASVEDLYALPQLPEEYKALSARLSEILALGTGRTRRWHFSGSAARSGP